MSKENNNEINVDLKFINDIEIKRVLLILSVFSITTGLTIQLIFLLSLNAITFFNWEHLINDTVILFGLFGIIITILKLLLSYLFSKKVKYGLYFTGGFLLLSAILGSFISSYLLIVTTFITHGLMLIGGYSYFQSQLEGRKIIQNIRKYTLFVGFLFLLQIYPTFNLIKDVYSYYATIEGTEYEIVYSNGKYVFTVGLKQETSEGIRYIEREIFPISKVDSITSVTLNRAWNKSSK